MLKRILLLAVLVVLTAGAPTTPATATAVTVADGSAVAEGGADVGDA